MTFDPDAYLEKKESEKEFNPDAYLAKKDPLISNPTARDLVQGTANAMPFVGSAAGMALGGGPLSPVGWAASAGGAALGKSVENAIEHFALDDPFTAEKAKEVPLEAAYDVVGNAVGEKILGPALKFAGEKVVGPLVGKFASGASKIPYQTVKNYAQNFDRVNAIPNTAEQADVLREGIQKDVKAFKTSNNMVIGDVLNSPKGQQRVSIQGIKDTLNSALGRIDPRINPEWAGRIKKELDIIDSIVDRPEQDAAAVEKYLKDLDLYEKEVAKAQAANKAIDPTQYALPELPTRPQSGFNSPRGDDLLGTRQNMSLQERSENLGNLYLDTAKQGEFGPTANMLPTPPKFGPYNEVTANQAHQLTQRLQNLADYTPDGQALKRKDLVDVIFQRAASKGRQVVNAVAPEIAQANKKLANLHNAGKNINKNMITADKPYSSMIGVGTGENELATRQLEKFQNVLGKDYISPMKDLASAQYYQNAGFFPKEKTGSSAIPLILSGGSFGLDSLMNLDPIGFAKAAALGLPVTPIGQKTLIGAGNFVGDVAEKTGYGLNRASSDFVQEKLNNFSPAQVGDAYEMLFPPAPPETPTQKAQRINQERKALKGGQ